jgi:site-specific recombinase XerD
MQPQTGWFGEKLTPLVTGFFIHPSAKGSSPCTLVDYRTALIHYGRWLEAEEVDPLRCTATGVKRFLAHLRTVTSRRGKPLSPKSILNAYVGLRSFYRWAAEELGEATEWAYRARVTRDVAARAPSKLANDAVGGSRIFRCSKA